MSSTDSSATYLKTKQSKRMRLNEFSQMETDINSLVESNASQPLITTQTLNESQTSSQCQLGGTSTATLTAVTQVVAPQVSPMGHVFNDNTSQQGCGVCGRKTLTFADFNKQSIECDSCPLRYHLECINMTQRVYDLIKASKTVKWICLRCLRLEREIPQRPLLNIT